MCDALNVTCIIGLTRFVVRCSRQGVKPPTPPRSEEKTLEPMSDAQGQPESPGSDLQQMPQSESELECAPLDNHRFRGDMGTATPRLKPSDPGDDLNTVHDQLAPARRRRTPGPFQRLSSLQSGSYGNAVAVRELGAWPEERVLCLKVFNKAHIVKNGAESSILTELASYKRLAVVEKRDMAAFVMELDVAMQDRDSLYLGMVRKIWLDGMDD